MGKISGIISLLAALVLWGCSKEEIPFVHRIDVQQGNVVTQDMLAKLKPGQDKRLVTHIMGTPLIVDVFHQDQWIYLYSFQKGHDQRVQRRISLYFDNDLLTRIDGDVRPAEPGQLASGTAKSRSVDVPPGSGDEDGGFLQAIIDSFRFEDDKRIVDPAMDQIEREAAMRPEPEATPAAAPAAEDDGILSRLRRQLLGESDPDGAGSSPDPDQTDAGDAAMRRKFSLDAEDVPTTPTPSAAAAGEGSDTGAAPAPASGDEESFFDTLKRKLGLDDETPPAAAP